MTAREDAQALMDDLQDKVKSEACPVCGTVGKITIREKFVARPLPDILHTKVTRGPAGFPLWAECSECRTGGRVAEVKPGIRGPS